MTGYPVFRLASLVCPLVPPRLGLPAARSLGDYFFETDHAARERVVDNLRHVLGDEARARETAREVYRNLLYNYYDLFHLPALSLSAIEAGAQVDGWEHVEAARQMGRGVILVSAHFGCVDLSAQMLAARGLPVTVPMERLRPEATFRLIARLRARHGLRIIPADGSASALVRALRRGEGVGLACDRDTTGSGAVLTCFGRPARLPTGYARLARIAGAPIVTAWSHRVSGEGRRVTFEAPLCPRRSNDRDGDVGELVAEVVRRLESVIAQAPGQWVLTTAIWQLAAAAGPVEAGV